MDGQGRPTTARVTLSLALFALLHISAAGQSVTGRTEWPPEMLDDAQLNDVFFVNADRGWSVGDRGVIWSTADGGRNWHRQESRVTCRLNSVCFIDDESGWAVGGATVPYVHATQAVVLRTRDAGRRWEPIPNVVLPALKFIRFFDEREGWAIGDSCALYPSGVFRTQDGGRSWAGVPINTFQQWLAGDFHDERRGALVSRGGDVALIQPTAIREANGPAFGLVTPRQLKFGRRTDGWLVGEGGLVLHTVDGGQSWHSPKGSLPVEVPRIFDFQALAVHGDDCWIAGDPGTCVFHSADQGRHWELFRTAQSLPIRRLWFVDKSRGWAVGALGMILATRDGGRTWSQQLGRARRAALLGLFSEPDQIPFELIGRLAGNEGYITVIELLNRRDVEVASPKASSTAQRAHDAVVAVGASAAHSAWRFPLRQPGLSMSAGSILEGWNQANGGEGAMRLEQYVVGKIRQWQPDVLVTQASAAPSDDPLAFLVQQIVLRAVERAGEEDPYRQQIELAALKPWKVKKVFCQADDHADAIQLITTQLAQRLGCSLTDIAAEGRALLTNQPQMTPTMVGFRLVMSDLPDNLGRQDFFSAVALSSGGEARRFLSRPPAGSVDSLTRVVQKRRNMEQLLARTSKAPQNTTSWLAQITDLTAGLSSDGAAQILFQLAWNYERSGQQQLTAQALEFLIDQYPEHDLSAPALVWLIQFYASGEVSWRLQRNLGRFFLTERARRAGELGSTLERMRPLVFAEPSVRFPHSAAARNQGLSHEAQRYYNLLARSRGQESWLSCARAELSLSKSTKTSPKPIYHCVATTKKPRLDGRLDDEAWRGAAPMDLKSALHDDATWPAAVMLSHDREFMYLAVTCRKAGAAQYPPSHQPRPRDPDLSAHDRLDLLIDLDRDYSTYYRLTVDHRGWTGEACCGDTTWEPTWFVAAASTDEAWTVEAAIPLDELTGSSPTSRNPWAVGLQRIVPNVGFQSWTQPAAIDVQPEGFGLLAFE